MCIRDSAQAPTSPGGKRPAVLIEAIIAMAHQLNMQVLAEGCLLYTSDAADERSSVDLGGRRIIKKKKKKTNNGSASKCRIKREITIGQ